MARLLASIAASLLCAAVGAGAARAQTAAGSTLDVVRNRGLVVCGVSGQSPGFSLPASDGVMRGIEADECRAIAAAVLGDSARVRFVPLPNVSRFIAIQSGEVDVLFANTTWTLGRDASQGLEFGAIYFFDGQGFMVKAASGVTGASGLDGATICMLSGGTTELNVADYFHVKGMKFSSVLYESTQVLRDAFRTGRCDVLSNDSSALASYRSTLGAQAADYVILPERFSNEPLAPAVRKGDDRWLDVVRWTHFALVTAEAEGITAGNVEASRSSEDPSVRRLLGLDGDLGQHLGLDNRWADAAIRSVGNFGEVWDRNITPTGLSRGLNALWTKGGLMFAPPMR